MMQVVLGKRPPNVSPHKHEDGVVASEVLADFGITNRQLRSTTSSIELITRGESAAGVLSLFTF
jgi:hypothetical protein